MAGSSANGLGGRTEQDGKEEQKNTGPIVILMVGMAGSGKSTLLQRLNAQLHTQGGRKVPYVINLDPAVQSLPYGAHIDCRDTVDYGKVMSEYGLGPNGGILTACNLFATRFDQVMDLLATKEQQHDYVLVDTPGQIEIFTWSASGEIVLQALAARYTTIVCFVLDSHRCINPQRFMSNMLQAVSVAYRSKLPVLLAFNKVDATRHEFALEWMQDIEAFQDALNEVNSYATDLSYSLALVLDEFYRDLRTVGTSAFTGEGVNEFFEKVNDAAHEFERDVKPDIDRAQREEAQRESQRKHQQESSGSTHAQHGEAHKGKGPESGNG